MSRRKPILKYFVLLSAFLGVTIFSHDVAPVHADVMQNYIVLYKQEVVPANADATIAGAGGTLIKGYNQIGEALGW